MHDVAAVTPGVAMIEMNHGGEQSKAGSFLRDDAAAAHEFGNNGADDQGGEHRGHQRIEIGDIFPGADAQNHHDDAECQGSGGGPHEIALQAFE